MVDELNVILETNNMWQLASNVLTWQAPLEHVLKLNIDAAFDHISGLTGLSMVVQDTHGMVLVNALFQIENIKESSSCWDIGYIDQFKVGMLTVY